jgi:pyruvate, water dikinase
VGSVTGHMAALAREYRVPTLVNTGVATQLLKTGDEITLDTSQNAVFRGTINELSRFELTEQEIFEESYEYRLLRRLWKKISPLNLVDSHSEHFKASRCRTYHDIVRLAHERAVEKLIDLSENYQKYHDRMPMRLESDIPLGLTVIDIEGGTSVPQNARTLLRDQILCIPLRALLDGLSESGMWTTDPVAMDLGSFMSSVTRTFSSSLAIPGKSGRNLAVVSREYMNLNLKLGYHFNLLDAHIGDTPNDNYISFRFLGGVTDFTRRSRRAKFIADVLEHLDFRVEVHGDLVVGRLKKISKERMCSKMKAMGGLIGYTRQLDVSMSRDEQVARHFTDFTQRIQPFTEVCNDSSGTTRRRCTTDANSYLG